MGGNADNRPATPDKINMEIMQMRDEMRKMKKQIEAQTTQPTPAQPQTMQHKIDPPTLAKEAVDDTEMFNYWTNQVSMYVSLTPSLKPLSAVRLLSMTATSKLSKAVQLAASIDRVPADILTDEKEVTPAEALTNHDIHVQSAVPRCMVGYMQRSE